MTQPSRLLAKSYDHKKYPDHPPAYALLIQHERDVSESCKSLAEVLGAVAFFNAGLDPEWLPNFKLSLCANGWSQDLGKGNSHFQSMVTENPDTKQLLRHETISGLLLFQYPPLKTWFNLPEEIKIIALWGAMGHHRKFDQHTSANSLLPVMKVYVSHNDFNTILTEMAEDLNLEPPPQFQQDLIISGDTKNKNDIFAIEVLDDICYDFDNYKKHFQDEKKRRLLALVKGFGICADVAASAIAKGNEEANQYCLQEFIRESLSVHLNPKELTKLIHIWAWKTTELPPKKWNINQLPPGFKFLDFQNQVAASTSYLTLAVAGCGSGKSIAAYLWAKKWCEELEESTHFRLIFCLPTTGTTTEHFKDYALESGIPEEQISLTHSRSFVDLEMLATTSDQEEIEPDTKPEDVAINVLKAQQDKIESLALWSTKLTVTTVDTVLGLMANARRSIYSLPALMQSAIVFDEIHALDERMFGHLMVFLKNFPQLPVLLMTASLPENRLQAIQNVRPDINLISGDSKLEELRRYELEYIQIKDNTWNDETVWNAIQDCLENRGENNGKVLWICNRVDWANKAYKQVLEKIKLGCFPDIPVNVYHSRFRYEDRSYRHRQVIDNFNKKHQPMLLITTQVAEMSLDISADLLISDLASIPSLIQRLGRLNRRAKYQSNPPKKAIICSINNLDKNSNPYPKNELQDAIQWLQNLINLSCTLSQKDLSDQFSFMENHQEFDYKKAEQNAIFFSGLWQTRPGMTRDPGYTISVILQQDYDSWKKANSNKQKPTQEWLRKYEVAIPFKNQVLKWDKRAGVPIAPDEDVIYDYDQITKLGTGAKWL